MATAEDLLEEMLEKQLELVRAKKGSEKESALEARLAELEKRLEAKPASEVEDAIEELDDDEWELVKQHRAAKEQPEPKPKPKKAEAEQPARRTRPGRKSGAAYNWYLDDDDTVQRSDIPIVYNGDDEPDEVELPDAEVA